MKHMYMQRGMQPVVWGAVIGIIMLVGIVAYQYGALREGTSGTVPPETVVTIEDTAHESQDLGCGFINIDDDLWYENKYGVFTGEETDKTNPFYIGARDITTVAPLDGSCQYLRVDNHVAHLSNANIGGPFVLDFVPMLHADPETFELIVYQGGEFVPRIFARDHDSVFYHGYEIPGADPETFELATVSAYKSNAWARDMQRAYYGAHPIENIDGATAEFFVEDDQVFVADKDGVCVDLRTEATGDSGAEETHPWICREKAAR